MKGIFQATIASSITLKSGICDMNIVLPEDANRSDDEIFCGPAGRFLELYIDDGVHLLPRPISICETDPATRSVRIVFREVGDGTRYLSGLDVGSTLRVLGPLGNGFPMLNLSEHDEVLIVGGGIGIPPLLGLSKALSCKKTVCLGYAGETFLEQDFRETGAAVHIATDDGSKGFKGNVVQMLRQTTLSKDAQEPACKAVFACGPKPMLRGIAELFPDKAYLSMEERMACGLGGCVGCAIKIKADNENGYIYKKVCKDGPVFTAGEIIWTS